MKAFKKGLMLIIVCMSVVFYASAQDDREDVIYLKNGNIYRGVIIEQIPGESMKIETIGGNVFTVAISEVTKVTKERKVALGNPSVPAPPAPADMPHDKPNCNHGADAGDGTHCQKKAPREFHYRSKGYMFQAQLMGGLSGGGIRIINGYKFGRFGQLGIGVGIDGVSRFNRDRVFNNYDANYRDFDGVYLPLFLQYSGDILKRRITPFYSLEAGYAFKPGTNGNFPFADQNMGAGAVSNRGGLMAGAGFGVKFYSKRRVFVSLMLSADYKRVESRGEGYYDVNGNYVNAPFRNIGNIVSPGLKFSLGF